MCDSGNFLNVVLESVLKDSVLVLPEADGSIILEERQAKMKVVVAQAPSSVVAIDVKRLNHLSMLLDGECRRICDYLLIADLGGNMHACFVELKKTLNDEEGHREQLRRSLPIFSYLISVCQVECQGIGWRSEIAIKYNLIAGKLNSRLDKQRVKRGSSDWPQVECYKDIVVQKFVGARIAFSKLSCCKGNRGCGQG